MGIRDWGPGKTIRDPKSTIQNRFPAMFTSLCEDPTPLILFGILAETVLAGLLLRTRRGVLLSWLIVTEQEKVTAALEGAAVALEANDLNAVQSYLDPSAAATFARAKWALNRLEITGAKIHNLEITIDDKAAPPTAKAHFDGVISYHDRRGEVPYERYASALTVELRKTGDRWLITAHIEEDSRLRAAGGRR